MAGADRLETAQQGYDMTDKATSGSRQNELMGGLSMTRRDVWRGAGLATTVGLVSSLGSLSSSAHAQTGTDHPGYDPATPGPGAKTAADYPVSPLMIKLSAYISGAHEQELPAQVVEKTKWHILDSLAAITVGSQLPAGQVCRTFARDNGGKPVSTVIGGATACDPMTAAMLNGTMGHSHEADDTGGSAGPWHPGINVIPAALALGEQFGTSGTHFLRAVTLGYDIGGRMGNAAGLLRNFRTPTVSVCGYFGAAAAAANIAGLSPEQVRTALSYTAQQSSGVDSFRRDPDHIEKGFLNGGVGARGGVTSALLVKAGFTGVHDIFSGPANFFALFRAAGLSVEPELLVTDLGSRYDVMAANFKRRPVAGAISAVLDSLEALIARETIDPDQIRDIVIRYEPHSVTDNGGPVDVNMQLVCPHRVDRLVC